MADYPYGLSADLTPEQQAALEHTTSPSGTAAAAPRPTSWSGGPLTSPDCSPNATAASLMATCGTRTTTWPPSSFEASPNARWTNSTRRCARRRRQPWPASTQNWSPPPNPTSVACCAGSPPTPAHSGGGSASHAPVQSAKTCSPSPPGSESDLLTCHSHWRLVAPHDAADGDRLSRRPLPLVSLAGPAPSGSTGTSRRCQGCFPPSRGSGCPQLHQTAATASGEVNRHEPQPAPPQRSGRTIEIRQSHTRQLPGCWQRVV
jgi:hypothetical protein